MKICQNVKQDTSSEKNSSQTVEIGNKTNERKQCQKLNIFNNKIESVLFLTLLSVICFVSDLNCFRIILF